MNKWARSSFDRSPLNIFPHRYKLRERAEATGALSSSRRLSNRVELEPAADDCVLLEPARPSLAEELGLVMADKETWHSNAELEVSVPDPRKSHRFDAQVTAGIRRSGSKAVPAVVTDISTTGFRAESEERLPVNSIVWLRIGSLAPQMARVVWSNRLTVGCRFDVPLHQSVLDQFHASKR